MKIRVFASQTSGFYGQLLNGFGLYRRTLRHALGVELSVQPFRAGEPLDPRALADAGCVALLPSFRDRSEDLVAALREVPAAEGRLRVLLDGHDQTSTPHFPVLPHVDRYVKSKRLRDVSAYGRDYRGGYVFADFYARSTGFDLEQWHFGSKPDPLHAHRILPGWNFAVTRRIRWLARWGHVLPAALSRRRYDVSARIGMGRPGAKWEWYHDYRRRCRDAVEAALRGRSAASGETVSARRYLLELRDSRLVFSPFGWGEICMRDYEAVACGALLLKPDVSHLVTSPDVFRDGETYVALRWDLADLEEKIDHYLANPEQAQAIASRGQRALYDYFEGTGFVDDVRRCFIDPL